MEKDNSIYILRFIAISVIVLNHLSFGLNDGSNTIQSFFLRNSLISSPLLAFISGNLFRATCQRYTLVEIIKKRSKSLIIPYIAWTFTYFLIYTVAAYIFRKYGLGFQINSLQSVSNDSLISMSTYFSFFLLRPVPGNFWFLQNLILVIPLTVLLHKVSDRRWFWVSILFTISYCYSFSINIWFSEKFLPYWILGYISLRINKSVNPLLRGINLLVICGLLAMLYLPQIRDSSLQGVQYILITLVVWTLIMTSWTFLAGFIFSASVINFCGRHGFFFHASHMLLLAFINKIVSLLPLSSLSSVISINLLLGFEYLLCFLLMIFSAQVIERLFPKIYSILSGYRN